jgi:aspartate-semialdehyde dehydrogenase
MGEKVKVHLAEPSAFSGVEIALFSAGGETSKILAPAAAANGAVVIDNSSQWRMHPDVPLVVPEVNPEDIALYEKTGIIANPNCSTIQLVVALMPLHLKAKMKRVIVSTYQAVSGAGKAAIDELDLTARNHFAGQPIVPKKFQKQIAFNCIPQIDVFQEEGFTKEEWKMMKETRKIMHLDDDFKMSATAVRVPVFNGHAESILVEFEDKITADEAREILSKAPGIQLHDDVKNLVYPTQIQMSGQDPVGVGRIRNDPSCENGLSLWCVADNIRKGAATNAV